MQKLALMKYSSNDNKICHALIWRGYGLAYKQPNDWWFGMSVFMVGPHLNQICTAIHQNRLPKFTISGIRMLLSWEWARGSKFNSNRKTLKFVFPIFSGRYTIKVLFSVVQQLPYPSCHWTENHIDPYLHHWCACLLSSLLGPRNRMQSPGHYQLGSPRILCSLWLFQPDEVVLHEPNIYIETENKRKLK